MSWGGGNHTNFLFSPPSTHKTHISSKYQTILHGPYSTGAWCYVRLRNFYSLLTKLLTCIFPRPIPKICQNTNFQCDSCNCRPTPHPSFPPSSLLSQSFIPDKEPLGAHSEHMEVGSPEGVTQNFIKCGALPNRSSSRSLPLSKLMIQKNLAAGIIPPLSWFFFN